METLKINLENLPEHPLIDDWMGFDGPFQGWLLTLNDEEFEEINPENIDGAFPFIIATIMAEEGEMTEDRFVEIHHQMETAYGLIKLYQCGLVDYKPAELDGDWIYSMKEGKEDEIKSILGM